MTPGLVLALAAGAVTFAGSQPQLASSGHDVYLTFAAGRVISVARSGDWGLTFAEPVTIPVEGALALGRHRGPRIAVTPRAVMVAAIVGARGGGADGDVVLYRSLDEGRTWSGATVVNDVPGAAREGLHAFAANASGLAVLAWLDLREKGTRIYAAVSRDHGATWTPDTLVYASPSGRVCECCHPSVAVGGDGRIVVMFRNSLDGRRDMYVVESRDGITFTAATKQGRGSWTLEACPMDGGGLAIGGGGALTSVWRREDAIYAVTGDGPEAPIGLGRDPAVAQAGDRIDVAWTSAEGIRLQRTGDGRAGTILGRGQFPSILSSAARTLVAWEDQGRVHVRIVGR